MFDFQTGLQLKAMLLNYIFINRSSVDKGITGQNGALSSINISGYRGENYGIHHRKEDYCGRLLLSGSG